ncbi:intermembrane transport protein PqiB [Polynucleobacter antarcticus]|uniref:MCE family protein n=1 Tax=Polynucleobacter antarcticus TaxID=1743162 RepID=A0A6M9Q2B5_9BURK|nr:MlaD family protein [Polynucleobacter antarcticus]QKM62423.1 MCE family protein [Polynucleobacter antarcticus]
MTDKLQEPNFSGLPSAVAQAKHRWSAQVIWIIPIVAITIGISLMYKAVVDHGPTITIAFASGDGIIAGKTNVKYKEVNIGVVKSVGLSEDHKQVIATIQLDKNAEDFANEKTRFWIVRPRITASGVSGLGTLLDGPFIGSDLGLSSAKKTDFVALDVPPILTAGIPGREFIIKSASLGSHSIGTPVYFRRLIVGQVVAFELDKEGQSIAIRVFINAPYDQYVTNNTRFWNASGVDITLGASGFQLQTESLVAVLAGGIAFETPQTIEEQGTLASMSQEPVMPAPSNRIPPVSERAQVDMVFPLFQNRTLAMKQPDSVVHRYVINFKQSVRGLSAGAPVEFRGVNIGEVVSIGTAVDPKTFEFVQPVEIYLYPERIQVRSTITGVVMPYPKTKGEQLKLLKMYIDKGLRAQLRAASLLTGQQYVGIDFFPNSPKYDLNITKLPLELQSVPGAFDDFEQSLASTIKSTDKLVKKLEAEVIPELNQALKNVSAVTASDSPMQTDIRDSLREITKAAGSMKTLTDMLDQQPQSLIFGKPAESAK